MTAEEHRARLHAWIAADARLWAAYHNAESDRRDDARRAWADHMSLHPGVHHHRSRRDHGAPTS